MADVPNVAKSGDEQIPPKLDLSKNGARKPVAGAGSDLSSTIHISMPPEAEATADVPRLVIKPSTVAKTAVRPIPAGAAAPAGETVAAAVLPGTPKKKETSRIPLDAATAAPGEGKGKVAEVPRTIRIRPAGRPAPAGVPVPAAAVPAPAAVPTASAEAPSPAKVMHETARLDDKRKTSRISLDAVYAPDTTKQPAVGAAAAATPSAPSVEDGRPKTIRLKRPGDAATIKLGHAPSAASMTAHEPGPPSEAKTVLSKTSRIDLPGEEEGEEGDSPTRRKTIKVKRPDGSVAAPMPQSSGGLQIRRTAAAAEESAPELFEPIIVEDKPNVFFHILAIASILVVCVTAYMFMAQAFGRDVSLSQLSYWKDGPDLAWPGKIPPLITQ